MKSINILKSISLILAGLLIGHVCLSINKHFPTTLGYCFVLFFEYLSAIFLIIFGYSENNKN